MTLSERLNDYKTRKNLSGAAMARKLRISETQMRNILDGKKTTGKTVLKMVDAFGSEFEQFLEYHTCECGKRFIQKTYNQNCCSDECSWKYNGKSRKKRTVKADEVKILSKAPVVANQKVGYAEFNERARSQGLSYGQLQGLERLGLR